MNFAAARQLVSGEATGRANRLPLFALTPVRLVRYWSPRQWRTAVVAASVAFLAIGTLGRTLPWTASGRTFPVVWWNYVTLPASSLLIGLIVATFAACWCPARVPGGRSGQHGRRRNGGHDRHGLPGMQPRLPSRSSARPGSSRSCSLTEA